MLPMPPATCPEGHLSVLGVVRVGIVFLILHQEKPTRLREDIWC